MKTIGKRLANQIALEHNLKGGCTFIINKNLNFKAGANLIGQPFYSVGYYPLRNRQIVGTEITAQQVQDFINSNLDAFEEYPQPAAFGSWYDEDTDRTHFDIVLLVSTDYPSVARSIGKRCGQKAIYNLATKKTIIL